MSYFDVGATELIARPKYYAPQAGVTDVLESWGKKAREFYEAGVRREGALEFAKEQEAARAKAAAEAQPGVTTAPAAGLKKYLPYVAIGVGGLILWKILKK
jgi:hypothetical protein